MEEDEEKLIKKANLFEIVVGNRRKNPISEKTYCQIETCLCGKEVAPNGQNMNPPVITFGEVENHVFDENSSVSKLSGKFSFAANVKKDKTKCANGY